MQTIRLVLLLALVEGAAAGANLTPFAQALMVLIRKGLYRSFCYYYV